VLGKTLFVSSPALEGVFCPHQDALKGWTTYEEGPLFIPLPFNVATIPST
jgi:hypothetical protein